MATPEDLRANAEYIRMADSFVEVPGGANNNNYANVRLIVETAESVGADAVWAGWGHASENPSLPTSLLNASRPILFIGPPAGPMHALGDKIGSTIIAQSAGVPCISWNGKNLRVNYATEGLPTEIYAQADVRTVEEAQIAADDVGYPLMIKASEGGGGKGIRKVMDSSNLAAAFRQVQSEVPGSPIFLMKLAPRARHLEVQLLADQYGNAMALFGRDCSVQRRHQKIVEEGPVLAAPPEVWLEMERAAVRLAKEVGYVNAGTVEYLWLEDEEKFAFLELNPRLQVEHPVTEMISNVNLPAAQLQVAMGLPLYAIPDIRRLYGQHPYYDAASEESTVNKIINFDNDKRIQPAGHVIAARITAENPDSGFQPTSGAVSELNFRSTPDVWGYFSVDSSGRVHEFADSQIGHLFAWGNTREDARQHMVIALKELSIRGDIRTTVEYLVHMMESNDFCANRIDTAWLDSRISAKITAAKPDALLVAMMGAVWRTYSSQERRRNEYVGCLERGQYPSPSLLSVSEDVELIYDSVKYSIHCALSAPNTVTLMCNGTWIQADFRSLSDGGLLVSLGSRSHVIYAKDEASGLRLILDGATCLFTSEYDPTQLRAAISGKLARYLVEDGAVLPAGAPYAEVEVMKMYMPLTIPEAGAVFHVKPEGSVLEPGDLIAKVELDDPSKVHRAEPFKGTLPQTFDESADTAGPVEHKNTVNTVSVATDADISAITDRYNRRWHIVARNAMRILSAVLQGYVIPRDVYDSAWFDRDAAFASPDLVLLEVEESFSVLASRLPSKVSSAIRTVLETHKESLNQTPGQELNVTSIVNIINEFAETLPAKEASTFLTTAQPLLDVCDRFRGGVAGAGRASLLTLVQQFLTVEKLYCDGRRPEDIIADLRTAAGSSQDELLRIYSIARAHAHLKQRNILVLSALTRITEELEISKNLRASITNNGNTGTVPTGKSTDETKVLSPNRSSNNRNLARGSFMSVSTRSVASENDISEREITNSPGLVEEDEDTLDIITQPVPGKSGTNSKQDTNIPNWDLRASLPFLHQLAELRGIEYSEVTLEARQMLVVQQLPSQRQRRGAVEGLLRAMGTPNNADSQTLSVREDSMHALVDDDQPLLDVLMSYFSSPDTLLRRNAAEVYVRRLYRLYRIENIEVTINENPDAGLVIYWSFRTESTTSGDNVLHLTSESVEGMNKSTTGMNGSRILTAPGKRLAIAESYVDLSQAVGTRSLPIARTLQLNTNPSDALALNGNDVPSTNTVRYGVMAAFTSMESFRTNFTSLFQKLSSKSTSLATDDSNELAQKAVNVLHISLLRSPSNEPEFKGGKARPRLGSVGGVASVADTLAEDEMMEVYIVDVLSSALTPYHRKMLEAGVRRITFNVPHPRDNGEISRTTHTPLHDAAVSFVAAVSHATATNNKENESVVPTTKSLKRERSSAMLGSPLGSMATKGKGTSGTTGSTRQAGSLSTLLGGFPWIYTFRSVLGYGEDSIVRHIEPPASANLELKRLSNFKVRLVPTPNRVVHVYAAQPRDGEGAKPSSAEESSSSNRGAVRLRYFVRAIVRQTARIPTLDSVYEQYPGPERMFVECLDALNLAMGDALADTNIPVGNNHVFLNVLPVANVGPEYIETVIKILARRYADRLRRLRVSQVEFKINVQSTPASPVIPLRLISSNPTGYVLRVDTYVESRDEVSGVPIFTSIAPAAITGWSTGSSSESTRIGRSSFGNTSTSKTGTGLLASVGIGSIGNLHVSGTPSSSSSSNIQGISNRGELDGRPVTTPYPVTSPYEKQRALAAALSDTVYVYDFIELLTRSLEIEWSRYEKVRGHAMPVHKPRIVLSAVELVLRPKGTLSPATDSTNTVNRSNPIGTGDGEVPAVLNPAVMKRVGSAFSEQFANEMGGGRTSNDTLTSPSQSNGRNTPGSSSRTAFASPSSTTVTTNGTVCYTEGDYELVEIVRSPGQNDIGMVAWRITMFTPQYGEESGGREIVLIANDITFRAGSFGTAEDHLFHLASAFARKQGIPRLYFAANSGARIGLAEDIKKRFKVAWTDPAEPTKGHKYLYLSPTDYKALCATGVAGSSAGPSIDKTLALTNPNTSNNSIISSGNGVIPPVLTRLVVENGEERYVITDIIGRETDLGVENLRGSGTIAGETSRAYNESFTLSYVTGRTVGIGAYLVRLGQRCIQKITSAPIILTGFEALNKLMGSEVYSSNLQLGGPRIMYTNGVSHDLVHNDFEGVSAVLKWLSFVPRVKNAPLPVMDVIRGDEADRNIDYVPPTTAFDPRLLLTGVTVEAPSMVESNEPTTPNATGSSSSSASTKWVSGFFDRDSWYETLGGWAKSVIVGRARLGGYPVGVVIPELRSTTAIIPADPASPASKENVVAQAGQVWYPDSAFKTAQAIRDFSGEDLPIIIFANWRGFSGGQRDMFDEVLKYGSYIVDALVACKQPVFVYIPPGGELRGGAWVVVDPTINSDVMEMYADPQGRGGVLEPSGTASIKFRARELVTTAHRLDPLLQSLDAQLKAATVVGPNGTTSVTLSSTEINALKANIRNREEALSGVYLQIAHTFADLHDTPGRMQAMGTIHGTIPWKRARAFFFWRLRRRIAENSLISRLQKAAPQLGRDHAITLLRSWYFSTLNAEGNRVVGETVEHTLWSDDVRVLRWVAEYRDTIEQHAVALHKESIAEQVLSLGMEDASAVVTGVLALISRLPPDHRESIVASLRRGIIFGQSLTGTNTSANTANANVGFGVRPPNTPLSPDQGQYF